MNILFASDSYLPHAGGSRVYYHNIYRRLAGGLGQRVTVLTTEVPGCEAFDAAARSESFQIVRRFGPLRSWKYYRIDQFLLPCYCTVRIFRQKRPDMLHVGDLYPQGAVAMTLKKVFGVPYAVYCHGEEITQMERHRSDRRLRDAIYGSADLVIAASQFACENLLRIGISPAKIRKVTPGVDCTRFSPARPPSGLVRRFSLEGKRVLLTVARLVPRKGHACVIEALARLAPRIPDLSYLVVGHGPEEQSLRRLAAERGVGHLVQFAGFVPDAELPDFYRACDVMVMPNSEDRGDIEGFGMVFLEANASGKPVVGGRSGGTAESVLDGKTGYLVHPDDSVELAAVLERILTDESLRTRLGQKGLERARQEFEWNLRARMILTLSETTIRRAPAAENPGLPEGGQSECACRGGDGLSGH